MKTIHEIFCRSKEGIIVVCLHCKFSDLFCWDGNGNVSEDDFYLDGEDYESE